MPDLTNEKYLEKVPNDFILTILVSRRVRELKRGSQPLIETSLRTPIEIAFEEIRQGKVGFRANSEEELAL